MEEKAQKQYDTSYLNQFEVEDQEEKKESDMIDEKQEQPV